MTLDQIFNHGAEAAQHLFSKQGQVHPMWIAETADKKVLPIICEMPDRESKAKIVHDLRIFFKKQNVIRYVSILEAWAIEPKGKEDIPESYRLGGSLASHPDRREIIQIQAEDKTEGIRSGRFYILRPEHGEPKLSDLSRDPAETEYEGLFVGLLS